MAIDNDNNIDRSDERRTEEKRSEGKRDAERRMRQEPAKTFEAKLAEKTAHEVNAKNSAYRQAHDQKADKKQQQSLVDKIIGLARSKETEPKTKQCDALDPVEKDFVDTQEPDDKDQALHEKKILEDETPDEPVHFKEGEHSPEGHRRVAEKTHERGEGGSGGSQQGSQDSTGEQGFSFDQQSKGQDGSKQHAHRTNKFSPHKVSQPAAGQGAQGFDSKAREFADQDLNEMVQSVQIGINQHGEAEFVIELSDAYFNGLKVSATRTAQGVILKFTCPSAEVRSTFLKFRPKVYARFKTQGISVFRIDVV